MIKFNILFFSCEIKVAKPSSVDVEPCVNGRRGVFKRHIDRRHNKTSQMSSSDEEDSQLQDVAKRKNSNCNFSRQCTQGLDVPSTSGVQDTVSQNSVSTAAQCSSSNSHNGVDSSASDNSASKSDSKLKPALNPFTRRNRQRQLEGLDRMEQRLRDLRAGMIG